MKSKLARLSADYQGDWLLPTLQTDRLTLRRRDEGARDFWVALDTDPEVMRSVHLEPLTLEDARKFAVCDFESAPLYRIFHQCLLEWKGDGTPVGSVQGCKYRQTRRRTDLTDDLHIGHQLAPAYWKKGYATEACSAVIDYASGKVQLGPLVAYPQQENRRSQRVLKKLGSFKTERAVATPRVRRQCSGKKLESKGECRRSYHSTQDVDP